MGRFLSAVLVLAIVGCFSENPFGRGPDDGTSAGPVPTSGLSFSTDVMPILSTCTSCHAGGAGGWVYDGGVNAYDQVLTVIEPGNPDNSELLINASGGDNHGGGTIFGATSDRYRAVATWIAEGANNN